MILGAVLTEKSLLDTKKGKYTFWVTRDMNKTEIKKTIKSLFEVDVVSIKTVNIKGGSRKTIRGAKVTVQSKKKAIVQVKDGQKIALFEEPKK
jgi:large subunit ribosomal protein L23